MMATTARKCRTATRQKKKVTLGERVARILGLAESTPRSSRASGRGLGIIGLDVGHAAEGISARRLLPLLALGLVVALGVASLRIEMIRLRYALAEASLAEKSLLAEQRSLKAERLRLRDPVHLAERAQALGFVRPDRLIVLDDPAMRRGATILAASDASARVALDQP